MVHFMHGDDMLTCKFPAHLDTAASAEIEKQLNEKLASVPKKGSDSTSASAKIPCKIVFDMADVTFVSSAFLRICMGTMKIVGKDAFSIRNTNPKIKQIFKIAGLDALLGVS